MLPLLALAAAIAAPAPAAVRDRPAEDEVIYFLLPDRFENGDPANDRGGLKGDRLTTGFDPTAKGFYHGGDLKGLIARLDYVQGLGATAIWLGPIFKNKPVQGPKGRESAGYHGYWITDFTTVDPHLGTDADMKALVEAVHARGMKLYMDIIANHTADVIQYRECESCAYLSRADSAVGYTPVVPAAERTVKVPAWLNDPSRYHNRGNSTFAGESSTMGDFSGLDDLATEQPEVIAGMIDIFGGWIDRYGIDGFRIDTAQHVNPEFWQAFVPPMLARAKARGIPNFHIFGEVAVGEFDPGRLARHTRVDRLPAVLDFAFARAVVDTVGGVAGTDLLGRLFFADALYEGGEDAAKRLPTFLGNHDAGRFASFIRRAQPKASDEELLARVILGHAMMMTLRGVPTIYSGDEQGFVGDGGDQDAREDLFASRVASYNDNRLLGTAATTAQANFDTAHPLYHAIAGLAKIRAAEPALRRGATKVRAQSDKPGLFAVSRLVEGREVLLAFNTSTAPVTANVEVEKGSTSWTALAGQCPTRPNFPGSVAVTVPPLGYLVCAADR